MNWITLAAVVTAVITILNLSLNIWLHFKGRSLIHRDALYKKHFDAYERIFELLIPLHHLSINSVINGGETTLEVSKHFIEKVMKSGKYDELLMEYQKAYFYLPLEFQSAMSDYSKLLLDIAFNPGYQNQSIGDVRFMIEHELGIKQRAIIASARHSMGVEALTKDILLNTGTGYWQPAEK